jgi:acetyl-CoA C-acetyltransferase
MPEAVIVSAARSPIGRAFKGSLKDVRPDDLTTHVIQAALAKVPELDPRDIDDLMLGCGLPGGEQGYNLGRVVAVQLGMDHLPGCTITRYCSSSLQTTRMALHAIKAGEGDVFISAGVETVSRSVKGSSDGLPDTKNPLFADAEARTAATAATTGAPVWEDPRESGLLPDVYIAMGQTAENLAKLKGVSRREQDEFGVRSQNLAEKAIADGFWAREITPVTTPDGTVVSKDDGPRAGVTLEAVSALKPVFRPDGSVNAGNCCPLRRAGLSIGDIDLVEINEAFAAQVIPSYQALGVDLDRLNVNGGGIAVGHPFGMTGARITTTLINSLQWHDKQFGLETMCVGGGQGMAMVIERLS